MVYSWDPLAEASVGEGALVAGVADLLAGPSLRHFAMAKTPAWLAVTGNLWLSKRTATPFLNGVGQSTNRSEIPPYGLGRGVGRGRDVGAGLGVVLGVPVGVAVGVGVRVAVAVAVAVAVGVAVAVAVAVAVGVGLGEPPLTAAKMSNRPQP